MKSSLLLPLFIALAHADELIQADLTTLNDPDKALTEVTRIVIGEDKDSYSLMGYQILKAEQANGKPPLYVLCGEKKYRSSFHSSENYEIEKPEEIFSANHPKIFATFRPSLTPLHNSPLYVFNHKGQEIRPFDGNNYIDGGYLFDFDGDGILDRADSTNYSLDDTLTQQLEIFELFTVEPEPRELLKVIFNWHPLSAGGANDWTYRCTDADDDGRPEIRFGPANPSEGENPDAFVFQWDAATKQFSAGEIPKGSHILVMKKSDSLKSLAAAGGLGYPLIGDSDGEEKPAAKSLQKPYEFHSFTQRSDKELATFFKGKDRHNSFSGAKGSFPNAIPEGFFTMQPKQAALALAEANRTAAHRRDFQLAIDDRHGIAPPSSGWMQFSWTSSGCYSLSTERFAIHFGVADPVLLHFGYNSIGVVGRNQWADQPAHSARIVKLSAKEATFLADTLFWLDRIRSKNLRRDDDTSIGSMSSSADGFASVSYFSAQGDSRKIAAETLWATNSISGRWDKDYNREVSANLAGMLILQGVPKLLQDRWQKQNQASNHSLMTPTEERLRDRLGAEMRKKLEADCTTILAMDATTPLPPDVIAKLASVASEEALVSLLPALQNQLNALAAKSAEEKEYEALEKRFERDHFGTSLRDSPQEHKQAYQRLLDLREKLQFSRSSILRHPLTDAVEKLRMASHSQLLQKAVREKSPHATWSLSLLLRTEPATWATLVAADFPKAKAREKQTILTTLIAGHPPAAAAMIAKFTKSERREFIVEIATYHQKHAPDQIDKDIPVIISLIADRKQNIYRRGEAMDLLSTLTLTTAQQKELTQLLLIEIKNPQQGEYSSNTTSNALAALAALPQPEQHLDFLLSMPDLPKNDFFAAFQAVEVMARANPQRETILANLVRTQFIESSGMMNYHFVTALTHDLRSLTKEIAAFASESPAVEDGDGANYSGGKFKSPVGQRYHIAREITALWSEKDPQTLARLWIAFIAAHPDRFDSEDEASTLRNLATTHIRALTPQQRKAHIQSILNEIPLEEYHAQTRSWLKTLSQ